LFEILLCLFGAYLAIKLEICFGPHQEYDSFLVGILSGFSDPSFQVVEAFLAVNAEGEENTAYSFVERSHDSSKGFLTGLNSPIFTVSQICNLTCNF